MTLFSPPTISGGSCYSQLSLARVYMLQATSLFPSHTLPAHFCCAPHPYSALDSQNLRVRSCALFFLALLVKPDQVSLGGHPFSRLQGTHPLQRSTYAEAKSSTSPHLLRLSLTTLHTYLRPCWSSSEEPVLTGDQVDRKYQSTRSKSTRSRW